MKIFVLHYSKLVERKKHIIEQFKKNSIIDYEFVERYDAGKIREEESNLFTHTYKKETMSLHLKHFYVYKEIAEKYESGLIFEDDVVFNDGLNSFFDANIADVPDNWKFLYFGGNHLNGLLPIKNNVFKMVSSLTTHAYSIKCDIIPEILTLLAQANAPIDVYYAAFHRAFPSYVLKNGEKSLVWQDDDYSDIDESKCDYTWLK